MPNELLPLDNRVLNTGNHICKWWNQLNETGGHWDNIGYKQGLRDCLQIMVKHRLIKDFSMIGGVTLMEFDIRK